MYIVLEYLSGAVIRYEMNPEKDKLYSLGGDVYLSHMDGDCGKSIYVAHGGDEAWVKSELDSANKAAVSNSPKVITVIYNEGDAQKSFEEFMLMHGSPHYNTGRVDYAD